MERLYRIYDRLASRLMGVGSDKYLHLLCCLLICALVGAIAGIWLSGTGAASMGFVAAVLAGVAKEIWDEYRGERFDLKDLAADTLGAAVGAAITMYYINGI